MKCIENEEEEATKSTEEFFQLSCFISPEVKYLQSGLQEVNHFLHLFSVTISVGSNQGKYMLFPSFVCYIFSVFESRPMS
jgi:hypothetical protein